MALRMMHTLTLPLAPIHYTRNFDPSVPQNVGSLSANKTKVRGREIVRTPSALAETAASIAVAATVVGAAATFLVRRTKSSEVTKVPMKTCEDCGGSGVCPECNGEGFVVKRLSEQSAERARLMAKNMATRYTAGSSQVLIASISQVQRNTGQVEASSSRLPEDLN
ncbi:hypothetical protein BUALT_Bualt02G0040400 [Buddleja alternifolia]|uniref:DUF7895 domain-containing protein n=1 Tax=Buddleja alternifolia TaxID=168488 RepID=A0AAV6Y7Y3_9LAMI|nr:hypothetical protein BUALT_Bualt02G0040400 [Buddleja alternifolia]